MTHLFDTLFIFSHGKDTQDPNPLIRALAVRTMGCIRVDKITEYLCDPLQRALVVSFTISIELAFDFCALLIARSKLFTDDYT